VDKEKASVRTANATPFEVSHQLASKGACASRQRRAKTTLAQDQRSTRRVRASTIGAAVPAKSRLSRTGLC
jgi:hypothetical protein